MSSAQSRPNIGRGGEKAAGREARAARLAAALKSNLRRRKAQARERASEDEGAQAGKTAETTEGVDETAPGADASHESA